MIPGEWSSCIPGVRGTIPGNSQRGVVGHQFPEGGRGGPGGLVLHQGGWDRSDPRGGNWIPGNSLLCSSVQIPPEYGDDWLNTNGC